MPYICGMKHRITYIILMLLATCKLVAQTQISGVVTDGKDDIATAISLLRETCGCSLLSGSGSSVFGLTADRETAVAAAERAAGVFGEKSVFLTETTDSSIYYQE